MKKAIFIFGLLTMFSGCSDSEKTNKNELDIQDKVEIKKEGKHQQFPGTRVFIVNPKEYLLIPSLIRFQKDSTTYLQAVESPINYIKQKASLLQGFETAKAKGLTSYYQKEFMLGDYNAFLIYGADNRPNQDQMVLIFGDTSFTTMISGELPSDNEKIRQEILTALLTSYVDKSVKPDNSTLENFTIDISKSDFKFNSSMSQTFFYTINGQGDPVNNVFENDIMIVSLPAMESFDALKEYARSMIERYKNNGIDVPKFEENEVLINGISAFEMTFAGSVQGKSVRVYQVILGNNTSTCMFTGIAYERQDELFEQFKEVAQTLRLK